MASWKGCRLAVTFSATSITATKAGFWCSSDTRCHLVILSNWFYSSYQSWHLDRTLSMSETYALPYHSKGRGLCHQPQFWKAGPFPICSASSCRQCPSRTPSSLTQVWEREPRQRRKGPGSVCHQGPLCFPLKVSGTVVAHAHMPSLQSASVRKFTTGPVPPCICHRSLLTQEHVEPSSALGYLTHFPLGTHPAEGSTVKLRLLHPSCWSLVKLHAFWFLQLALTITYLYILFAQLCARKPFEWTRSAIHTLLQCLRF